MNQDAAGPGAGYDEAAHPAAERVDTERLKADAQELARLVVERAGRAGITLATAESLTAGLVAATIADVPGASAVLRGGVVSYALEVKERVLGVDAARLASHGPVDGPVAEQMAAGAARVCEADLAVSTTGVAGPEPHGGQPVGTVYVGVAARESAARELAALGTSRRELAAREPADGASTHGEAGTRPPAVEHHRLHLDGDRNAVRWASVCAALRLLLARLDALGV